VRQLAQLRPAVVGLELELELALATLSFATLLLQAREVSLALQRLPWWTRLHRCC
jgi:hypothetical protein